MSLLLVQACALSHTVDVEVDGVGAEPISDAQVDGDAGALVDAAAPLDAGPEVDASSGLDAAAHRDASVDAGGSDDPCGEDWVLEGDACVRWREVAAYPAAECGGRPVERGMAAWSSPLVRCGDIGLSFEPWDDVWLVQQAYERQAELLGPLAPRAPGEIRQVAWLWGGPGVEFNGVLVLRQEAGVWRASHARWSDGREVPTLDPPVDFEVLLPMNHEAFGQAIAAGEGRSAIYERRPYTP